jgi:hypothetical protein
VLLAFDAPVDAHRRASTFLCVGQVAMPLSPHVALLPAKATLLFVWLDLGRDGAWALRYGRIADTTAPGDGGEPLDRRAPHPLDCACSSRMWACEATKPRIAT